MSWDHRTRVVAVGVAIQPVAGTFVQPGVADLMAISAPANSDEMISVADPTMSGAIWEMPRIYLGRTGTAGATVPLRGPGAMVAANTWGPGKILQSFGFAEIRQAADIVAALQAGSTASSLVLDAARSATDDSMIGCPISQAAIGSGFQSYSMTSDYDGAAKRAYIPETIVAPAAGANFTLPANLTYLLGTMTAATPLLSICVWRDKKCYRYLDCRGTSLGFDMPVANRQNQVFPSFDFTLTGAKYDVIDEAAPSIPQSILNIPVPALRGGKFVMDRVKLGHAALRTGINAETAGASNAHQAMGEDAQTTTGGSRSIETDLNQMSVADFDIEGRTDGQTKLPIFTSWGAGVMNRFGFIIPNAVLDPHNPGDRNGFVNLTGAASPTDVDKSMALAVW